MKMLVVFVFALTVCSISADPILRFSGPDGIGGIDIPDIPGSLYNIISKLIPGGIGGPLGLGIGVPTDEITNITGLLLKPDLTKKLTCAILGYLEIIRADIDGVDAEVENEDLLQDLLDELDFVISKVSKILDLLPRNEVPEPIRKAIKEIDNILRETTATNGEVLKRLQDVIAGLQTSLGGTLDCPKLGIGGPDGIGGFDILDLLLHLISVLVSVVGGLVSGLGKLIEQRGLAKPISKLLGGGISGPLSEVARVGDILDGLTRSLAGVTGPLSGVGKVLGQKGLGKPISKLLGGGKLLGGR